MNGIGGMAVGGAAMVLWIILIIAAILLFLLPFFVFKIRNQVVEINLKMSKIIELISTPAKSEEAAKIPAVKPHF